jgi:RimJ/RimL family protein N-acetyltransferase
VSEVNPDARRNTRLTEEQPVTWFLPADEPIRTDRLALDPLTAADAEAMVDVLADPALYTVIGGEPPTLPGLRDRYRQLAVGHSADGSEQWLNWIIRLRGEAAGYVQATVLPPGTEAEIAWVVGVPWQGRGLAGEAAAALVGWLTRAGATRVSACIHPGHAASRAVAARAGLAPTDEYDEDGEQRWVRPSGSAG